MKINRRDNTKLICDVGEMTGLFTDSTSLESFLQRIVVMVAEHMQSEVCSIYLYHDDMQELVLSATTGLNSQYIGKIKLKLGEGLTGLALKELRPVRERYASKNPHFRYFPGLGEEEFNSFLVVPIIRGSARIGAIVIQNKVKDYFTEEDVRTLRAITSQLANTIEMARMMILLQEKETHQTKDIASSKRTKFIKGQVGSEGIAYALAAVSNEEDLYALTEEEHRQLTLVDFREALSLTENQLEAFQKSIEERLSDEAALIFSAQILMLKDKGFVGAIERLIEEGISPVRAIQEVVQSYIKKFENIANPYLRERIQDVRDIGEKLLKNLLHLDEKKINYAERIVIAREMFPSDVLKLSTQKVKGVVLLSGGATSHTAILAQSLGIPMVIVDDPTLMTLPEETKILLDAESGYLHIHPSKDILDSYYDRLKRVGKVRKEHVSGHTATQDGTKIYILANINLLSDVKMANEMKVEGIGLYRTEFPFIVRSYFPTEEEQFVIYQKLIKGMPGKELTFRTLDIGGDKVLSYFDHYVDEKNPFLGMRSIRFSLKNKDIFEQQIRAILRAGHDEKHIRIMFPMISSLEELLEARKSVEECLHFLKKEKIPHQKAPQLGVMIELPSAVEIIEELVKEVDFVSIGTNDLVQYMLAVDRTNEKVADLYCPYHPAVLRALKKIVNTSLRYQKDVSICGDMAHEEKYLKFLLGIGLRKLSLNPPHVPKIQKAIQAINLQEAQKLSELVLSKARVSDIKQLLEMS
jgi:phosphotransferase system enzyme I (PtsP)